MSNPLRQLKFLPWLVLFQVAALSISIGVLVEALILLLYREVAIVSTLLNFPLVGLLLVVAAGLGVGALAVVLLERLHRRLVISAGILWALIFCLLVVAFFRSLLPLPAILIGLDGNFLIGVIVGVFWKGRSHWRW